ncbi:hypothetical protein AB0D86_48770 [Streptomyces sp. NPDC048324]|uniref:hypothetical protein n=1 Tax=Streptomyces sp. NPDC048324 TaxID=3157205 RepID=UPI003414D647
MRTLALRGGARIAAEWSDAFSVVTRERVQLKLRDGEPGPVLGRDAEFWLRGTGARALRNPAVARRGCPQGQDRHMPVDTPPYAGYRMMEERHEQHE